MRTRTSLLPILVLLIATPAASAPPPCNLVCPANISTSTSESGTGAVVTYATPAASPGCSSAPIQLAGLPSGTNFPIGTTTNCFIAAGVFDSGTCCFTVSVTTAATAQEPAIPVPSGRPSTWWTLAALTLFAGVLAATRWLR